MFFDPNYQSEYRQCYDEFAKKSIEKYLRDRQGMYQSNPEHPIAADYLARPTQQLDQYGKPIPGPPLGQDAFFSGPEHDKYNSHQKRQMHLKGQWKIQDMDPEGSI